MKTRTHLPLSHLLLGASAVALLIAGGCTATSTSEAIPNATEKQARAGAAPTPDASATNESTSAKAGSSETGNWQKVVGVSINWRPSFEAAMKEAKETNKPVLIDFYATWCGPCKMMDKQTWTDPEVIKESANWVMVKVDGEKRHDVSSQYGLSAFPTIAFLRPDGKPANMFVGFKDPKDTLESMRSAYSQALANMQSA